MEDGQDETIKEGEKYPIHTWRDGIHSYLTYLRDRLTVARDLLTDSGSIFVQIGDENVHLLRSLLDEVFCVSENFCSLVTFRKKTMPLGSDHFEGISLTTFFGMPKINRQPKHDH